MQEWKGTEMEKALVSIHPERFVDIHQVARSVLFVIGNEVYGSRRNLGSLALGIQLDKETGNLNFTHDEKGMNAESILNGIIKGLGTIPEGCAEMPEPKAIQRTKANKYTCPTCKTNVRCATPLEAFCLHAGKPEFGQPPAKFEIQIRVQPEPTIPTIPPVLPQGSVPKLAETPAREARMSRSAAPRNFGQEGTI